MSFLCCIGCLLLSVSDGGGGGGGQRKTVLFDIIITSGRREVDQDFVADGFILMWFWLSISAVKVFASRKKKKSPPW